MASRIDVREKNLDVVGILFIKVFNCEKLLGRPVKIEIPVPVTLRGTPAFHSDGVTDIRSVGLHLPIVEDHMAVALIQIDFVRRFATGVCSPGKNNLFTGHGEKPVVSPITGHLMGQHPGIKGFMPDHISHAPGCIVNDQHIRRDACRYKNRRLTPFLCRDTMAKNDTDP